MIKLKNMRAFLPASARATVVAGRLPKLAAALGGALFFVSVLAGFTHAQPAADSPLETLPMHSIPLGDKGAFRQAAPNWRLAGNVQTHSLGAKNIQIQPGSGIIVNTPSPAANGHLITEMEHGDIELELDFLLPNGSNSGIYLQGRYEVQLFDSWGVDDPTFSDCGGIYQRWDASEPEGKRGQGGHAPLSNASRAPGLWQHVKVIFSAPEFDSGGHKMSNASFREVWLNGVLIQKDVEVRGPTRAALFDDEKPTGPLMIQGDHGAVAIRNITYKTYDPTAVTLENLTYGFYKGAFDSIPAKDSLQADSTAQPDSLTGAIKQDAERYFLQYNGQLTAPNAGTYLFKVRAAGMLQLVIDGKNVIDQTHFFTMDQFDSQTITLDEGPHRFQLRYINHPQTWLKGLALYVEGPQLRLQPLHAANSVPESDFTPLLPVKPGERIKIIRSFGEINNGERMNVINVGAPHGISYSYDAGQGELLKIWNGGFVDTKNMWINRGESQLALPLGSVVVLDGLPPLARLRDSTAAWPDSIPQSEFTIHGYTIPGNNWPEYNYTIGSINVSDQISGTAQVRRIVRRLRLESPAGQSGVWVHLASGKTITKIRTGEYVVDDRSHYLKILSSDTGGAMIRTTPAGREELIMPVRPGSSTFTLRYALIW